MKHQFMAIAVGVAVALAAVGTAAADPGGNGATGSIGTVQVGPVSAEPAVDAATQTATAAVAAPTAVPGSGGNQATDSVGSAQVGSTDVGLIKVDADHPGSGQVRALEATAN